MIVSVVRGDRHTAGKTSSRKCQASKRPSPGRDHRLTIPGLTVHLPRGLLSPATLERECYCQ
jgi:hypothetical protein